MTLKGFNVLGTVIESFGKEVIDMVISERDANLQKDYYDEIEGLCAVHGITFYNRKDKFQNNSKYHIAISWRWLINDNAGSLIVLHDSLLPKYRGFNPLVTALINGDDKLGVTSLYATEDFDAGDIIYQSSVDVSYPITIAEAIDKVSYCYIDITKKIFEDLINGRPLPAMKQFEADATYSIWRDEDDYFIDWEQPAEYIKRFIDAIGAPYKGAKSLVDNREVRILKAEVGRDLNISNRTPGKVIFNRNDVVSVICGEGILDITEMADEKNERFVLGKTRVRFRGNV